MSTSADSQSKTGQAGINTQQQTRWGFLLRICQCCPTGRNLESQMENPEETTLLCTIFLLFRQARVGTPALWLQGELSRAFPRQEESTGMDHTLQLPAGAQGSPVTPRAVTGPSWPFPALWCVTPQPGGQGRRWQQGKGPTADCKVNKATEEATLFPSVQYQSLVSALLGEGLKPRSCLLRAMRIHRYYWSTQDDFLRSPDKMLHPSSGHLPCSALRTLLLTCTQLQEFGTALNLNIIKCLI